MEDTAPIREGMSNILHKIKEEYQVVGKAADGVEGLTLIRELKPDLVIMDIQMPDMDGLTMLEEVRKLGIGCRVVVLTAYSDFNYAKRAIELGIENYLLKPIKISELKRVLEQVGEALEKEKRQEQVYSLGYIFKSGLSGHLKEEEILEDLMMEKYGFSPSEPVKLLLVWLDGVFGEYSQEAVRLLESVGSNSVKFNSFILPVEEKMAVAAILYNIRDGAGLENYFQQSVVPMLISNLGNRIICGWAECENLDGLKDAFKQILEDMEWNLLLPEGTMITHEKVERLTAEPFIFPMDLENKIRRAVSNKDALEYRQCLEILKSVCTQKIYQPKEIKDGFIRFFMTLLNAAKEYGVSGEGISAQELLRHLSVANTWEEITGILTRFFEKNLMTCEEKEGEGNGFSPLVQKARALILEYYNQGITLEETARKLHVSDEYLSTQFKKEVGKTFTETVRSFRIEKIKKLLVESDLKLTQIAAMTGYSDPKYMSKVFRDEVGVLPAEYRKREI